MSAMADEDYIESSIRFELKGNGTCRKLENELKGTSYDGVFCAIDFMFEENGTLYLVEVKRAERNERSQKDADKFEKKAKSGGLIDNEIVRKCRDSLLYLYGAESIPENIEYIVLIEGNLESVWYTRSEEQLKRRLPIAPLPNHWKGRSSVRKCQVFDLRQWNRQFPQYPARVL